MTDKIRVGIIGANANYGWSKRAHLPALLGIPDFELTAVCTSRPETAEESKAFYGAKLAFHDYAEMANHPDVDLVVVSVSVPAHYGMVTAGLQAGKHVFCEWPLGANSDESAALATLAREKGVRTLIGLQARGGPALLRLRELVAEGYVGEMLACNMTMFLPGLMGRGIDRAWMADRANGANTLSIASGHALDIFCYCVGEFRELSAQVSVQLVSGRAETAALSLLLPPITWRSAGFWKTERRRRPTSPPSRGTAADGAWRSTVRRAPCRLARMKWCSMATCSFTEPRARARRYRPWRFRRALPQRQKASRRVSLTMWPSYTGLSETQSGTEARPSRTSTQP